MYYLTGLPMSFRTLLISSIEEQRVTEAAARRHPAIDPLSAVATQDHTDHWGSDTVTTFSGTSAMVCTPESAETDMAGAAGAAAAAATIATDDRLGLFS
ncbi:hypothetical protein AWV80_05765 [Cupriavidus sp. UYMU48A]|nr:hypothetical protein AWV80_05765 [Cupriavidus sp. UYMU48A]